MYTIVQRTNIYVLSNIKLLYQAYDAGPKPLVFFLGTLNAIIHRGSSI